MIFNETIRACDYQFLKSRVGFDGRSLELVSTGRTCGLFAVVRYTQSPTWEWVGHRCAQHADMLDRERVTVERL